MNPFQVGDIVIVEINDPDCIRPPRLAVVTFVQGPVVHADYSDGRRPGAFRGSYQYLSFPPG